MSRGVGVVLGEASGFELEHPISSFAHLAPCDADSHVFLHHSLKMKARPYMHLRLKLLPLSCTWAFPPPPPRVPQPQFTPSTSLHLPFLQSQSPFVGVGAALGPSCAPGLDLCAWTPLVLLHLADLFIFLVTMKCPVLGGPAAVPVFLFLTIHHASLLCLPELLAGVAIAAQ